MNKKLVILIIIILVILILGGGFLFLTRRTVHNRGTLGEFFTITKLGCDIRGGRIIKFPNLCENNELMLGFVEEIQPPSVCCSIAK